MEEKRTAGEAVLTSLKAAEKAPSPHVCKMGIWTPPRNVITTSGVLADQAGSTMPTARAQQIHCPGIQ